MTTFRSSDIGTASDDDGVASLQIRLKRDISQLKTLYDTDLANAQRFLQQHSDDIRWTPERGWYIWDGKRWQVDDTWQIYSKAKLTVGKFFDEIRYSSMKDDTYRWAKRSQSARAIKDLIFLAQSDPRITARLSDFDGDPWLFNCENGIVDLRSGQLQPHARGHMLSRISAVEYDPNAHSDRWAEFLDRIMDRDTELLTFMQRAVGYSLTGCVREQVLLFCYGGGQNGKSVFLETIQRLLGDYGLNARTETIMAKRDGGIPNDVARLAGARFVAINETADGQRLHEPLIKDMTGGDTMTARFLHREYFDFRPNFKLWLRGNHKPQIKGTDEGIWRRIRLIPFTVTIPESERDGALVDKLANELAGILTWAVKGCVQWYQHGLGTPKVVADAVKEYRTEMDVLGQFLTDRCCVTANAQVTAKALYAAFRQWAEETGETAVNQMRFGLAMGERGFHKTKERTGVLYHGIELPVSEDPWRGA